MLEKCHKWCEKTKVWADLPLRLALGIVFFAHGGQKLFGWWSGPGVEGFGGFLSQLGFAGAGFWTWVVALVEFVGGIMVFIGLLAPLAAGLIAIDMLVALLVVHRPNGFFLQAGGIEFTLTLFTVALYFTLAGAHKWALDGVWCKKKEAAILPPPAA